MDGRRFNVVHVITKLELGGAQENTLYIARRLDRGRYAPSLLAGPGGMLDEEALALEDVPFGRVPHLIREIRPWSDYRAYRELRREFRQRKPAVVHTHSSKAGVLGRLAAAAERVPVIIHTVHGFGIKAGQNSLVQRALLAAERKAARRTTHFVPVSRENFETGLALGLFDETRATIILEGAELRPFREAQSRPELLKELGIPAGAAVVGMVACFKPQKNPLAFVEVAARVLRGAPEAYFLMVGDGELRPLIERRIGELGLGGRLVLAGWRRDVPHLLKLMRVSVLTSVWEGLPRVIPQSLSAGVPVVVTRAGGAAEAVIEGRTGFVCEQGDTAGMADRVIRLLRDGELASKMGAAAPASVGHLDADKMVREHESLYERLLEGGKCPKSN